MKLYHYNTNKLNQLKSLHARGLRDEKYDTDDSDPFSYGKNISLFLEPIPLNLPTLLNHEHDFWKTGVSFYEHEINSRDIPDNIFYRIVESHEKTKMIYELQDWSKVTETNNVKEKYLKEISDLEYRLNYKGEHKIQLIQTLARLDYDYTRDYKNLYELHLKNKSDNLMSKYAPCVPHLMIYPDQIPIRVSKIRKITLVDSPILL